jgi:hypothetical protein
VKRSVGITISAVITFLGSGATLLWGASMFLIVSLARVQPSQPRFLRYGTYFLGMLLLGFAAWGIASGVGLLRLREWARISLLVFSGFLLFCSLPGLIVFLVMPIPMPPNAGNPELFRQTMIGMRIFVAVFNGILIALSTFWLWFLNTRATREQFKNVTEANSSEAHARRRPLSISIIGWYLLISAFTFPAMLFLHFPVFFLGVFLRGRGALVIWLVMCVLQVIMGIGLLKLKASARIASIYYFAFFVFNSFAVILIPGSQARFEEAQAEIVRKFAIPPTPFGTAPDQVHFPMWFGVISTLPLLGVLLWFLIKNKPAFAPGSTAS